MQPVAAVSVLLTGLLTGATLSGCSYEKPAATVEQPVGLTLDAPRVTLASAGSGKKQVLTYKDIGSTQELTYTATEGFSQDVLGNAEAKDAAAADVESTTTTLPLKASVDTATENVEGQLPATRNAFVTAGQPQYTGGTDVDSATGFQCGWRGTDTGQMNSLRLAAPQAATDEARGVVEQAIMKLTALPIIFPEDAIGTGATWTVESRVTGESTLLQTTTYTLDSLEGDVATLSVKVEQRPSLGALSFDGQSGVEDSDLTGKELKVLESTTDSEGSLTVDLTKPLPTDGDVSFDTKITYGAEGSDLRVVQSSATQLTFGA